MRLSSLRRSRAVAATLSYFFLATASLELPKPRSYENTAIVRSIDLAGSTTEVQTTYQVRSLEDNNSAYYIALSEDDAAQLSVMEVKLKGSQTPLEVETHHAPVNNAWLYRVTLPTPLRANDNATIVMNTVLLYGSYPLPEAVRQNEPQRLVYETGLYVPSSYETVLQRTKFRVPHPEIISFTDTPALHKYADAANNKAVTRSGVTITYGPFHFVPATTTPSFNEEEQQLIKIHYTYDAPVIAVPKLRRLAEVSHWGANLNIQDEIWLKNNGARLKGQFSRVDYHMDYLRGQLQPHILNDLILSLPTGVRDPYYYDIIGNVSTSNFRASGRRPTLLELKPRYPLLGGWNYTFTLGYDMPLQNWAKYDSSRNTYVLAVPFMTAIPGAAYDDVEVKVILPERASVLEVHPPFPCDEIRRETHVTYLDSVGRPAIIFNKKNVSGKHAEYIYIKYRVSTRAYLQKPIAVATAFVVLFSVAMTLRRIDFKIHSKKQA